MLAININWDFQNMIFVPVCLLIFVYCIYIIIVYELLSITRINKY